MKNDSKTAAEHFQQAAGGMAAAIQNSQMLEQARTQAGQRARAAYEAQVALPQLLSGMATWRAMQSAVEKLRNNVPGGHDVVIMVGDVTVHEAYFIEPHTFLFEGANADGDSTWIVLHFSQLHVAVIHRPKRGKDSVITGFNPHAPSA